jgi:hypothetical protein
MINYGAQICNPMEINVFISNVDQDSEIIEHSTFEFISFEVKSSCSRFPYVIKEFMISKIKLSTLDPKNICYTFNNNGIQQQSCTM